MRLVARRLALRHRAHVAHFAGNEVEERADRRLALVCRGARRGRDELRDLGRHRPVRRREVRGAEAGVPAREGLPVGRGGEEQARGAVVGGRHVRLGEVARDVFRGPDFGDRAGRLVRVRRVRQLHGARVAERAGTQRHRRRAGDARALEEDRVVALEGEIVRIDALATRLLRGAAHHELHRVADLQAGQRERERLVVRVVDVARERARVRRLGEVGREVDVARDAVRRNHPRDEHRRRSVEVVVRERERPVVLEPALREDLGQGRPCRRVGPVRLVARLLPFEHRHLVRIGIGFDGHGRKAGARALDGKRLHLHFVGLFTIATIAIIVHQSQIKIQLRGLRELRVKIRLRDLRGLRVRIRLRDLRELRVRIRLRDLRGLRVSFNLRGGWFEIVVPVDGIDRAHAERAAARRAGGGEDGEGNRQAEGLLHAFDSSGVPARSASENGRGTANGRSAASPDARDFG